MALKSIILNQFQFIEKSFQKFKDPHENSKNNFVHIKFQKEQFQFFKGQDKMKDNIIKSSNNANKKCKILNNNPDNNLHKNSNENISIIVI